MKLFFFAHTKILSAVTLSYFFYFDHQRKATCSDNNAGSYDIITAPLCYSLPHWFSASDITQPKPGRVLRCSVDAPLSCTTKPTNSQVPITIMYIGSKQRVIYDKENTIENYTGKEKKTSLTFILF